MITGIPQVFFAIQHKIVVDQLLAKKPSWRDALTRLPSCILVTRRGVHPPCEEGGRACKRSFVNAAPNSIPLGRGVRVEGFCSPAGKLILMFFKVGRPKPQMCNLKACAPD